MDLALQFAMFFAGLVFGSFLNVCISRIPHDHSIVTPGSHCPHCGEPIRWRHNVPILSYVLLGGRCAGCRERISLRYPAVELLTSILFLAVAWAFGFSWYILKFCVFSFLVLGLIFMDAETGLLPAEFTYTGILLGLGLCWVAPVDSAGLRFVLSLWNVSTGASAVQTAFWDALAASAFGAAFFYLFWAAYYMLRRKSGIGFGDLALSAMAGAFLGLKLLLLVLFAAPLLATVTAIPLVLATRRKRTGQQEPVWMTPIPFGVYLGIASLFALFFGESVWKHYLGWVAS